MFNLLLSRGNSYEYLCENDDLMLPSIDNYIAFSPDSYYNTIDKFIFVDVIALMSPEDKIIQIPEVRAYQNANGSIDISDLTKTLKTMGYNVDNKCISYYSSQKDMYIYCGKDPLPANTVIPADEISSFAGKIQIQIRFREDFRLQSMTFEQSFETQVISNSNEKAVVFEDSIRMEFEEEISANIAQENSSECDLIPPATEGKVAHKTKKTRERGIGEVMEKVLEWRQLYNGYKDSKTGKTMKMSLEAAATKIGISKKSLDDYLLQIRCGKALGFNFIEHYNDRVGVLRAFVKKNKGLNNLQSESIDNPTIPLELSQLIEKRDAKNKQQNENDSVSNIAISKRSKKIRSNNRVSNDKVLFYNAN